MSEPEKLGEILKRLPIMQRAREVLVSKEKNMAKRIEAYEIINHGVEWSDYFQGCGVCGTEFTDVATGIGESEEDAAKDALELLSQNDWDTDSNSELTAEVATASKKSAIDVRKNTVFAEHPWIHISIRVR